jgi:hypothetical protein
MFNVGVDPDAGVAVAANPAALVLGGADKRLNRIFRWCPDHTLVVRVYAWW